MDYVFEEIRFWIKVTINPDKIYNGTHCWEWTDSADKLGYGRFFLSFRRTILSHRWAYEFCRGLIPDGLELDHLCRNPRCVNPWHLEAVTHQVNMIRGKAATKTLCLYGHPFYGDNLVIYNGIRRCRTCQNIRGRIKYFKQQMLKKFKLSS